MNPEEVVEDDSMDWEWEKGNEPSVDEQMRNLREKMAEMSLRVERLERSMPLGCEESGSSSGGGEWAWWSGAWWVKTNMRMNSASRRRVHRAISQSLGKSSERNKLCEEKTSDIDDDEARRRRKLGMEAGIKRSRRVRNEQANFEKGAANFRNASKADGACVNTLGLFFRITYPEQGYPVLAWNMLSKYPCCVSLKSPILPARILWQFCKSPWYRNCTWSIGSLWF